MWCVSLQWDVNSCHKHCAELFSGQVECTALIQQKLEFRSAVLWNDLHIRAPWIVDEKAHTTTAFFSSIALSDRCSRLWTLLAGLCGPVCSWSSMSLWSRKCSSSSALCTHVFQVLPTELVAYELWQPVGVKTLILVLLNWLTDI